MAFLTCNQAPPDSDGTPSLLTFRDVETLLHEFGHGLQHMLTTVGVADTAGINGIEWDAVELPSQMMEHWCYHKPSLRRMSQCVPSLCSRARVYDPSPHPHPHPPCLLPGT